MAAGQESDHQPVEERSLTDDHMLEPFDQSLQPLLHGQEC